MRQGAFCFTLQIQANAISGAAVADVNKGQPKTPSGASEYSFSAEKKKEDFLRMILTALVRLDKSLTLPCKIKCAKALPKYRHAKRSVKKCPCQFNSAGRHADASNSNTPQDPYQVPAVTRLAHKSTVEAHRAD